MSFVVCGHIWCTKIWFIFFGKLHRPFVSSFWKIDILVCAQRLSQEILRLQAVSADNSCRIQWLAVRRRASPYVFACLYILMAYGLLFWWSYGQEVLKYPESRVSADLTWQPESRQRQELMCRFVANKHIGYDFRERMWALFIQFSK